MVTKPSTALKIVGGDPALDLVNSTGDDRVADPLDSYAAFAAWAARVGVVDAAAADRLAAAAVERPAAARRAVAEARALRGAMDAVFRPLALAHGGEPTFDSHGREPGGEPPPDALARIVQRAGAAVERAGLVPAGDAFVPVWGGDHLERPLWPLAVAALDLLRGGPLDRLKTCEACPWLFLDSSRNRSRRWCSMDECGVRIKMRRYRSKPRPRR